MARLTTHVLDTANGCPAAGMALDLWFITDQQRVCLVQTITNQDGRTDIPLLQGKLFVAGRYELIFAVAAYFRRRGVELPEPPFLEQVPIHFGIADTSSHYHVPLLVSPWAYSTYRGS
jgi:5-hydroxyisourate hydrolase